MLSNSATRSQLASFLRDGQQPDGLWKAGDRWEEAATYWGTTWAVLGLLATTPSPH